MMLGIRSTCKRARAKTIKDFRRNPTLCVASVPLGLGVQTWAVYPCGIFDKPLLIEISISLAFIVVSKMNRSTLHCKSNGSKSSKIKSSLFN